MVLFDLEDSKPKRWFSCWNQANHPNRVYQTFVTGPDTQPRCKVCGAVMTSGRYSGSFGNATVTFLVDPKTGITEPNQFLCGHCGIYHTIEYSEEMCWEVK